MYTPVPSYPKTSLDGNAVVLANIKSIVPASCGGCPCTHNNS